MKLEKKLIACSILAIAIGIATIVPLAFLMSPAKAQTTLDMPWFNLNVPYVYWTANTSEGGATYITGPGTFGEAFKIALNLTASPDVAKSTLPGARIEYYQMQVYSDQGQIANLTYYFGVNCTGSVDPSSTFSFARANWFNTTTIALAGFMPNFNGTLNPSLSTTEGGIVSSTVGNSFGVPKEILNLQNAQVLYIDVRRLGYVTFNGNSTVVTLSDSGIDQHMELTKYGDGFLYNTIIPQNELAQANPLYPAFPRSP